MDSLTISEVIARQTYDSLGELAIKVIVTLSNKRSYSVYIPYSQQNIPLSQKEDSVNKSVEFINTALQKKMQGISPFKQSEIDTWLQEIEEVGHIGSYTTMAISYSLASVASRLAGYSFAQFFKQYAGTSKDTAKKTNVKSPLIQLPVFKKNDEADFENIYVLFSSQISARDQLNHVANITKHVEQTVKRLQITYQYSKHGDLLVEITNIREKLDLVVNVLKFLSLRLGYDVFIGLNIEGNQLYQSGNYNLGEKIGMYSSDQYISFLSELRKKYSILLFENPFANSDIDSIRKFYSLFNQEVYICHTMQQPITADTITTMLDDQYYYNTISLHPYLFSTVTQLVYTLQILKRNKIATTVYSLQNEMQQSLVSDIAYAIEATYVNCGTFVGSQNIWLYDRFEQLHV